MAAKNPEATLFAPWLVLQSQSSGRRGGRESAPPRSLPECVAIRLVPVLFHPHPTPPLEPQTVRPAPPEIPVPVPPGDPAALHAGPQPRARRRRSRRSGGRKKRPRLSSWQKLQCEPYPVRSTRGATASETTHGSRLTALANWSQRWKRRRARAGAAAINIRCGRLKLPQLFAHCPTSGSRNSSPRTGKSSRRPASNNGYRNSASAPSVGPTWARREKNLRS
jgi:hypothetical protein